MKNIKLYLFLVFIIILSFSTYGQLPGVIDSQGGTATITNYVFDGDADAYMLDEDVTATMLDGVADPQTWVVRMKIDVTSDIVGQGVIGTSDGFSQSLKWEMDQGTLNDFDLALRGGTGTSSIINVTWGPDTGWNTYFWTYNSTVGMVIYKGTTSL